MKKPGMYTMGIQFEHKQFVELKALAEGDGSPVGALVRDAVDLYLETRRLEIERKRAEAQEARRLTEKVIAELQSVIRDHPSDERLALLESMRERLKRDITAIAAISDPSFSLTGGKEESVTEKVKSEERVRNIEKVKETNP